MPNVVKSSPVVSNIVHAASRVFLRADVLSTHKATVHLMQIHHGTSSFKQKCTADEGKAEPSTWRCQNTERESAAKKQQWGEKIYDVN